MKNSQKRVVTIIIAVVILLAVGASIYVKYYLVDKNENQIIVLDVTNNNVKTIDLSGQELQSVPPSIFLNTGVEELDISDNSITGSIPAEIRLLTNLRILDASNNLMTGVPAEIGQLQNLEILDLSNNKITGLPNELGNLKNLKTLDISGNVYSVQDLAYIRTKLSTSVNIIVD